MRGKIKSDLQIRLLSIVITIGCGPLLSSCEGGMGYQGGSIPVSFTGIDTAVAISPETIKLSWTQYPGSNLYNVYSPDSNTAIAQPTFNTYLFSPAVLDATKTYQYSVSAKSPTTGLEVGNRTNYHSVQLLPHFNFKNTGSVAALTKTSIQVSWTAYPSVTYKVYLTERLPTGVVNYNQFVATTIPAVTDVGSAVVTGLAEGHEYCAIVVASYLDSKNDGPDGVLFTGDIGTRLSSNAYMVNSSNGTFNGSIISQSQKCVRTKSDFSVADLQVYAPKATFSDKPIFYVSDTTDTDGDNNIGLTKTEIYKYNETTGYSTLVGQTLGSGTITAQSAIAQGKYKFFAVATDMRNTIHAQAVVEIRVGKTGTIPATDLDRKYVYIRSYAAAEDVAQPVGYYPEKQQVGMGSQHAGQSVAMGDFNCDGKKDIAIGVPDASLMANDNRPAKQGKVIIYYNVGTSTPAASTRTQEITFDITSIAGDAGRNLRLGTKLFAANFNKDNQLTNQSGTGLNEKFQCDDLVIGSGYGPMFVLYGMRDMVPGTTTDGGLNFINSTSFSSNPSSSCDYSTNVCSPSIFYANNPTTQLGLAMTAGDFNGDAYIDLAVTSMNGLTISGGINPKGIWVFRGGEYGLIPPDSFTDGLALATTDSITTTPGPYPSFPYIPIVRTNHTVGNNLTATPAASWGDDNFGIALTSFHNAYYDTVNKRVRDLLIIGNPNSNNAHVCIPTTTAGATFASDPSYHFRWDCATSSIAAPSGATQFGYAMADIQNALRYRPDQFKEVGCEDGAANCPTSGDATGTISSLKMGTPSAMAISALGNGKVYLYYLVAKPTSGAATRAQIGAARNTNVTQLFQYKRSDGVTNLAVTADAPCNVDTSVTPNVEYCDIQQIQHPTSSAGNFGQVVNAFTGNLQNGVSQAKDTILAIAAPSKSFTASGGYTFSNVGAVQIYQQNSTFESNPFIVQTGTASSCDADGICRYSDGFSNSLTTALNYDGPNMNNIYFGLGGIVGGPIVYSSDLTDYNTNSDIVIGAPGYVVQTTVGGATVNVIDNGAAFAFWSHGGTYRTYSPTDSGPSASVWHIMSKSLAQESDFKFHQAVSIGDINQDGSPDVATRINRGYVNSIRIYNGSTSKVGVNTASGGYTNFQVQGDSSAGMRFIPAGKLAPGQFPYFFLTGQSASYLFSSGIGGLVNGVPTNFGTGGVPRKFSSPASYVDSTFGASIYYLGFQDSAFYNAEVVGNLDTTLNNLSPFAHGDFNGDGYEDFAMGMSANLSIADLSKGIGCSSNRCGAATGVGSGRVLIFYGGENNGFQTQPDSNGGYPLTGSYFTDYSADAAGSTMGYAGVTAYSSFSGSTYASYVNGAPCLPDGTGCRIQVLHEGSVALGSPTSFGSTITSVPVGNCVNNGVSKPVSALVVQAIYANAAGNSAAAAKSKIYIYKPSCLKTGTDNSGLISYPADKTLQMAVNGVAAFPLATLNSATLGMSMAAVGDPVKSSITMGGTNPTGKTIIAHLAVSDQTNTRIYIHPVYSYTTDTVPNFGGYDETAAGGRSIIYTSSVMVGGASGSNLGFANGMTSAGDLNGDGYLDLAVGMTALPRLDINTSIPSQGAILILFGGDGGAQTHTGGTNVIEPSRSANCYLKPVSGVVQSICNPSLVYLPQAASSVRNGAYERSFLSPYASMDFGTINESLGALLMGVPGKDSLDQQVIDRILQGGAFYVGP